MDDDHVRSLWTEYRSTAHNYDYNKTWGPRLKLILSVIEEGETRLHRALAAIVRKLEISRNEIMQPTPYLAFDVPVTLPPRGGQRFHRGIVVGAVQDLCSPNTENIIELGSGWGEHLCNVWCEGGPEHATYYACEISEYGRRCALVLAALEPGLKLKARYFNYVQPCFDWFPSGQKEVVVYSVHSVEQVRHVAPDLIHRLCALADDVKGVHFEPIGWQMIPEEKKNPSTIAHEQRCKEKHYNENFWQLLKQAEAEGLITIESAVPNLFGLEYNPASYVVWRKRRP